MSHQRIKHRPRAAVRLNTGKAEARAAPDDSVKRGRAAFLHMLRQCAPSFWRTLHDDVWLKGGSYDALRLWACRIGVRDEWLLQAVIETLVYWSHEPDSPNARLEAGHQWFFYSGAYVEISPVPEPVIQPAGFNRLVLETPSAGLAELNGTRGLETPEEIERKMREYVREYRRRFWANEPELFTHAGLAVCRWARVPLDTVIEKMEGRYRRDPEGSITRLVSRFARKIDLRLPPWT